MRIIDEIMNYNGIVKNLVTIHNISKKKVNYHNAHHVDLLGITFKGQDKETVSEYANKHFNKYKLLIIDEIGYLPIGEQEAKMFF